MWNVCLKFFDDLILYICNNLFDWLKRESILVIKNFNFKKAIRLFFKKIIELNLFIILVSRNELLYFFDFMIS